MNWTTPENDMIRSNTSLGSVAISQLIFTKLNLTRTARAVREQARRLGLSITNVTKFKPVLGKWRDRNGKWRTRVNGRTITLGRDGLDKKQVVLSDGRVVSRSELLRLNRLDYSNIEDPELKELIKNVAALDERVHVVTGEDNG